MIVGITYGAFKRMLGGALVAIALLFVAGCGDIYGHEELQKLVMNKPVSEIEKTLGKPVAVDSSNPARVVWTYNSLTYDIENENKRDSKTVLVLAPDTATNQLKVIELKYER